MEYKVRRRRRRRREERERERERGERRKESRWTKLSKSTEKNT